MREVPQTHIQDGLHHLDALRLDCLPKLGTICVKLALPPTPETCHYPFQRKPASNYFVTKTHDIKSISVDTLAYVVEAMVKTVEQTIGNLIIGEYTDGTEITWQYMPVTRRSKAISILYCP
ncbi:Hypothetical protein PHPALM_4184, partial [Phytophthora palmivora]